jgi:hypothetical protein
MCRRNADQFTKLIAHLLTDGWAWSPHKPNESALVEIVSLGRAHRILSRACTDECGPYKQFIHIFRGRREYAVTRYDLKAHQIGEWSAWIENASETTPEGSRKSRLYWI